MALQESRIVTGARSIELEDKQLDLLERYDEVISEWATKTIKSKIAVRKKKDIYEVISARTEFNVRSIKKDSEKMLGLFKQLNKKIVGQQEAIKRNLGMHTEI